MKEFLGVLRYEYGMSIRRRSLWLAFGILIVLHLSAILTPPDLVNQLPTEQTALSYAATVAFMLNLFMPVVGGILAADRLVRDRSIGVNQLLNSTPLKRWTYLGGKYAAALLSICTPVLLTGLLLGASAVAKGAPLSMLPDVLLAFLGINLPAYVFIIAFSLGCPLVMPLRVYQVLFTGYWFWGNFISPEFMPTLNGTYLTANGHYMLLTIFGGFYGGGGPNYVRDITSLDAGINLAVLACFALLALLATDRSLVWQTKRA